MANVNTSTLLNFLTLPPDVIARLVLSEAKEHDEAISLLKQGKRF